MTSLHTQTDRQTVRHRQTDIDRGIETDRQLECRDSEVCEMISLDLLLDYLLSEYVALSVVSAISHCVSVSV